MIYTVVHILETDDVTVASNTWIIDEYQCRWPPYNNRNMVKKAILEHHPPSEDWKTYDVAILGSYDNYAKAKIKAQLAIDISNLEPVDSTDPDWHEEMASEDISSGEDQHFDKVNDKVQTSSPPPPVVVNLTPHVENVSKNENIKPESSCHLTNSSSTAVETPITGSESTSIEKEILKELENIQCVLDEQTIVLKQLCARDTPTFEAPSSMPKLPVDCIAEMEEWENYLCNSENFNKCIHYFLCRVGHDIGSSVRRMLAEIITNRVAMNFNWKGRPPKKSFQTLRTADLILRTIKGNPLTKEVPMKLVEDVIKDWLKHAPFRETYSKNKQHKIINNILHVSLPLV